MGKMVTTGISTNLRSTNTLLRWKDRLFWSKTGNERGVMLFLVKILRGVPYTLAQNLQTERGGGIVPDSRTWMPFFGFWHRGRWKCGTLNKLCLWCGINWFQSVQTACTIFSVVITEFDAVGGPLSGVHIRIQDSFTCKIWVLVMTTLNLVASSTQIVRLKHSVRGHPWCVHVIYMSLFWQMNHCQYEVCFCWTSAVGSNINILWYSREEFCLHSSFLGHYFRWTCWTIWTQS